MASDRTNILVAARVRPLNSKEGIEPALHVTHGEHSGTIHVERGAVNKQFNFDFVFGPESEQTDVFAAVKPLVESILDGYNATVFAYGQTGSGKTFTMGTDALSLTETVANCNSDSNRRGVVSRSTEYLFSMMAERRSQALSNGQPVPEFSLSVVFVEIYNDDVIDLLTGKKGNSQPVQSNSGTNFPAMKKSSTVIKTKQVPNKKANVRCTENGDIVLDGVTSIACDSSTAVLSCLQEGSLARRTATTAYNERSSRSHAIFTIVVNQHRFIKPAKAMGSSENGEPDPETVDDLTDEVLVAKMHFVDLAGSERLHDAIISTGSAAQERFREGVNINMGLLTLGKVISLLSEGKTQSQYIPYRESKLTRLLQDSLGGNSRTLMIACVSAAECYIEQSLNTLQYATNARKIKNQAVVNRASSVAQLRAEINMLRKRLESRNGGVDIEMLAEVGRLRQENDEMRSRIASFEQEKIRRLSLLRESEAQTEPLADIVSKEAAMLVVSKLKAVKSPETGDSTLTDSKLIATNSFRHLYDKIVSEQAEIIALKEQLPSSGMFSPSQPSRFLSENSDIGRVRERRRKRNTEMLMSSNNSSFRSSAVSLNSISEKDTTPQLTNRPEASESGRTWEVIMTASSIGAEDEDDEYRDPTYEPTPLKLHPNTRNRRRFECVEDDKGNRRLTRAAKNYDPEPMFGKKSRIEEEPGDENGPANGRDFCRCHGLCKISRCACRRNGNACVHGENGCNCDAEICNNKGTEADKTGGINISSEAISIGGGAEKPRARHRRA